MDDMGMQLDRLQRHLSSYARAMASIPDPPEVGLAKDAKAIRESVEPMHDDLKSIEARLEESYNQINILRKELEEERERRETVERKAEETEKKCKESDQRLALWLAVFSVVFTVAFELFIEWLKKR